MFASKVIRKVLTEAGATSANTGIIQQSGGIKSCRLFVSDNHNLDTKSFESII